MCCWITEGTKGRCCRKCVQEYLTLHSPSCPKWPNKTGVIETRSNGYIYKEIKIKLEYLETLNVVRSQGAPRDGALGYACKSTWHCIPPRAQSDQTRPVTSKPVVTVKAWFINYIDRKILETLNVVRSQRPPRDDALGYACKNTWHCIPPRAQCNQTRPVWSKQGVIALYL